MNAYITELHHILKNKENLSDAQIEGLKNLVHEYPYFQMAWAIYLKAIKDTDKSKYNQLLPLVSISTTDRELLISFLERDYTTEEKPHLPETEHNSNNIEATHTNKALPVESIIDTDTKTRRDYLAQKRLEKIRKELSLLSKSGFRRGRRLKQSKREQLIEAFLKNQPKIVPDKKYSTENLAEQNHAEQKNLMTETLAQVYVEQKKYDLAISAYRTLILKNPQKSAFFAEQIGKIEQLKFLG